MSALPFASSSLPLPAFLRPRNYSSELDLLNLMSCSANPPGDLSLSSASNARGRPITADQTAKGLGRSFRETDLQVVALGDFS